MRLFVRDLFLPARFFAVGGALVALAVAGTFAPALFDVARGGLAVFAALVLADGLLLWATRGGVKATRAVPDRLSNGDPNEIAVRVASRYRFPVRVRVLDERPVQFQARDAGVVLALGPRGHAATRYVLRPTRRGVYRFGAVNLYAASPLGLVLRRFRAAADAEAAVYPSVVQMRRYALLATSNRLTEVGVKRVRRVGHTFEFDQVRPYVPGDDRRSVNWKATARRGGALAVNQFGEERAQPVYVLLDMGRTMRSPFDGLTLLDHAVNAALVLANVALLKGDRVGLVAFDDAVETVVPADRRPGQLARLLDALYRLETGFHDPSYEAVVAAGGRVLRQRGLVLLFTNVETRPGLDRQLPYLRRLARGHRLVVVFFENTGLADVLTRPATRAEDVYVRAVAEGLDAEKREIARELERHGIGVVLTHPSRLTVDALNRYLALKAQGEG